MSQATLPDSTQDEQHLKLISIFHFILGGIVGLFACMPVFHFLFGIAAVIVPVFSGDPKLAPMALFGGFFAFMAATLIFIGWVLAGTILYAGSCLAKRQRYMFCFVVACVECIFMPIGTVLGVFTIIVLNRPSVKSLFGAL